MASAAQILKVHRLRVELNRLRQMMDKADQGLKSGFEKEISRLEGELKKETSRDSSS